MGGNNSRDAPEGEGGDTYIIALVNVEIGVHESLVGTVDGSKHAGPGLLEGKHALDIVSVNLFARDRIYDDGLDTEEGERGATRLGWRDSSKRSNDIGSSLSLPVRLWRCSCQSWCKEKKPGMEMTAFVPLTSTM